MATNNKPPLTKEQIFNLEMLYKPMFFSHYKNEKAIDYYSLEDLKTDNKKFLRCISKRLSSVFTGIDKDRLYVFIEEYKEYLDWKGILESIPQEIILTDGTNITINNIVPKYETYFNEHTWNYVTKVLKYGNEDFIRKYKYKLNWNYLSKKYRFTYDFIKEMIDFVILPHYFSYNTSSGSNRIKNELLKQLKGSIKGEINESK